MLDLYKNIKKLRLQMQWSQDELAKRTGYTDRSSIAKIEKGQVDLPQSKILLFADIFRVTPGELMGNDGIDDILSRIPNIHPVATRRFPVLGLSGHRTDYIMKRFYRHALTDRRETVSESLGNLLAGSL